MTKTLKLSYEELLNLNENLEKRIRILEEKVMKFKNVEEGLRESEQRFKQLADSTSEGILIHENGTIIDTNLRILSMLGYTESEVVGKSVLEYVVTEYRKEVIQGIRSEGQMAYTTFLRKKKWRRY